ncbi:MAG: glycosyltransferase family 4 protein [Bacteroidales bacterium]|nr:glycosyltransferase family 4 protein [Bacteroidales bacterium]
MKVLLICNYKPGVGGISGQVELLQKHLREEGHTADIFSTKASVWRRLTLPLRLRRVAKHYDMLHIHCCSGWGFLPAVIGITVGRKLGKRIVLTYHGGGGETFFNKHPKLVRHYLIRTDTNIVLSGFLANVFEQYQLPYTIIPNIIELDNKQFRQRDILKPSFICTRAHEPLYNIPCILRAFHKVQAELPNAMLTLVGDGSEHQNLMQMVDTMRLHNVTFTGKVANNDIYTLLDQADIMLSSPTVDNMPVSLLEAMNAGLLVISSRVGGVPYMIKNGSNGLLFESNNHDELAKKMLWAIENQAVAKTLIQQAYRSVNQYRWENVKEKLYTAYGLPA